MKKLFRNPDRGNIFGVCHGLGYYFNMDPVFIRVGFIMAGLLMPPLAILTYLVMWLAVPKYKTTKKSK